VKKVLVIDDSQTVRQQVALSLKSTNYILVEAADGLDGLARAAEEDGLALVFLDVNMPRLNGLETLERLKADPKTRDVPVLMLTTEVEKSLMDRARKAGAKAWLVKPIKPDLLLSAVVKICG